ncbi:MAG: VOC family protein [Fimbriimonadales bacterium]|nr:VOC family protein [Fimbriimonadales bacterium]
MRTDPEAFIAFLPTRDLEAAHAFWNGLVGLRLALDQGSCRIYRAAHGGFLGFCASAEPPEPAGRVVLTIVTHDVEGWHRRLSEAGVRTDGVPRLNERFRIVHFYADAPDGYRLEVQRFEDPRWPGVSSAG